MPLAIVPWSGFFLTPIFRADPLSPFSHFSISCYVHLVCVQCIEAPLGVAHAIPDHHCSHRVWQFFTRSPPSVRSTHTCMVLPESSQPYRSYLPSWLVSLIISLHRIFPISQRYPVIFQNVERTGNHLLPDCPPHQVQHRSTKYREVKYHGIPGHEYANRIVPVGVS